MTMTLEEIKLAVCEKLPKLVDYNPRRHITRTSSHKGLEHYNAPFIWKSSDESINWPTEGLQVCHEAEKLLTITESQKYMENLSNVVREESWPQSKEEAQMLYLTATQEQRLEALCRVWFPERFAK